jgi:S-adenosylmethionine synthetase
VARSALGPIIEAVCASALITALVRGHFDLRPAALVSALDLRRPIYRPTAAYGHFGRDEPGFTWERADKAAVLRAEAGLGQPLRMS